MSMNVDTPGGQKGEGPHNRATLLLIMFSSWHAVSGFPVKAVSLLISRANSAYPAVGHISLTSFAAAHSIPGYVFFPSAVG